MNQSYLAGALAFHEQRILSMNPGIRGEIPADRRITPGAVVRPDGSIAVSFYAPKASSVTVTDKGEETVLSMEENGLWTGVIPDHGPGHRPLAFYVDGVEVMNPTAPMGYGANRPMNCIDVPDPNLPEVELRDVPHGSICREYYFSKTTGRFESCLVYAPPGYGKSGERYPVLYLQHGHGENENCWVMQGKMNFILDNLLAEGKAKPMLVVMNDGMVTVPDAELGRRLEAGRMEQLLLEDCIPVIEERYRTLPGKENRAMAGLSMGSMQTSIITLNHPEMFDYAGVFSGFLHNLFVKPGERENHLDALAAPDIKSRYKVFYRAIGESDPFLPNFLSDDALLAEHGLHPDKWENHIRRILPGAHEWLTWRYCLKEFLPLLFQ